MAEKHESIFNIRLSKKDILKEKLIRYFFTLCGMASLLFIALIFLFLLKEGVQAFSKINAGEFISGVKGGDEGLRTVSEWYPTSDYARYSLLPLIAGTLLTAIPATLLSALIGVAIGVFLSEFAGKKIREFLKPVLELFASIPTVVLGFIFLAIVATFVDDIFLPVNRLNALIASLGLSVVIIPVIASLTEEALRSVPKDLRSAAYGLGATKTQTVLRVLLPAATSGISAGILLGFGRAIGETMIVIMTAGNAANLTADIFRSVRTMTATIAAEMGEVSQGSAHYYSLFVIGLVLFFITFLINLTAERILTVYRKRNKF